MYAASQLQAAERAEPQHDLSQRCALFLLDLLLEVERIPGTGVLHLTTGGGTPIGRMLLSHGHLCLLQTCAGSPSLSAYLVERHPDQAQAMRVLLRQARAQGRKAAEVLPLFDSQQREVIRVALFEQIVDALCALAREHHGEVVLQWEQRCEIGADSVLSMFPARDVYHRAVTQLCLPIEDAAYHGYEQLCAMVPEAFLYVRQAQSPSALLPLTGNAVGRWSLGELDTLAQDLVPLISVSVGDTVGQAAWVAMFRSKKQYVVALIDRNQIAVFGALTGECLCRVLACARSLVQF